ncbi:SH3 and cysteine-rich domain-containing protein isoform X2 [Protopterus annectens]|uniref:SH3 and cysteine-rich domain-containing protein isoform X2 n=1 Tax=Protopterus annectens TaxID=7888 RepID=UPI001CFBE47B|nr:SH3 and cysteine-rich domain-containing protein isoform X2 [Protopterus annectens]
MIPQTSVGDDHTENENPEEEQPPLSPASTSSQESKLQRLKKSLSFKTKSLRSKSADNFFQRTNSDVKLQVDLLTHEDGTSTGQLSTPESLSSTPTKTQQQHTDSRNHTFQEYVFKKPTFCDVCNHMIVAPEQIEDNWLTFQKHMECLSRHKGTNSKHGLRCKACKMSIHHKCSEGIDQQRCMGKLPKGFRRYYSSPLLIQEQYGCIREVMPIACSSKVDPVYEALRFGTSLAQKTKKTSCGSVSESPDRSSTSDLADVPEEGNGPSNLSDGNSKHSDSVFNSLENGTEDLNEEEQTSENIVVHTRKDPFLLNTYVALYRFVPQETQDLEIRPGDRICLLDESNEDWWKGKVEDRVGFFPANFVQRVRAGERIFRCTRTYIGCKEQGQITIKEGQVCVSGEDEHNGFLKVYSGKKKGFVPIDVLEII